MGIPFAIIDSHSEGKFKIAEKLITTVVNNGWSFIIVKNGASIRDRVFKNPILLTKCGGAIFYAVSGPSSIKHGIKCLLGMGLWHKPVFHVLVGSKGIEKRIAEMCKGGKENIEAIEEILDEEILCYVDPVDDQLELYGGDAARKVIMAAFPSLQR